MGGVLDSLGEWLQWLAGHWWFWALLVLIALAIVVALSLLFWAMVIRVTRWAFSTWPRALVALPVLVGLVVLFIRNFAAILQWVNDYWPITMIPTLIVVSVPLIMIYGLFSGGGSSPSSSGSSSRVCTMCGAVMGTCHHTSSAYSEPRYGQGYDMFSDPKNHADLD